MNRRVPAVILILALSPMAVWAQEGDWLERLGDSLTFASSDGSIRARASGTFEVDAYYSPATRADLRFFDGTDETLVAPRLCLFLDAQCGEHVYAFAQIRVDRGLDPADEPLEIRFEEL